MGSLQNDDQGLTVGQRANAWRRARNLSTEPSWIMTKATEEIGEVARALVGEYEERDGRGDVGQEAAQTVIVLASLLDVLRPGFDLFAAVEAELDRLGAPPATAQDCDACGGWGVLEGHLGARPRCLECNGTGAERP